MTTTSRTNSPLSMSTTANGKTDLAKLVCIDDFEAQAEKVLSKMVWNFAAGGSDRELALRRNLDAYKELILRPRRLIDVSKIDLRTNFLGESTTSPIAIAPVSLQKLLAPDGELATRRAAENTGSLMALSTSATSSLEEVAKGHNRSPLWFQLYVFRNRLMTTKLIRRAENAGYKAIVVVVDSPVLGRRLANERDGFTLPAHLELKNLIEEDGTKHAHFERTTTDGQSALAKFASENLSADLTWLDLEWLVRETPLPVIIKGVLRADDTERSINCGVKGIIVSNHGGRQLDSAPATIWALPEVVQAAKGRVPVWIDGGIRSGEDVFKALALGADGCFVGRPMLWGLACGGEDGVEKVLRILHDELRRTMQLTGCRTIQEIRTIASHEKLVVLQSWFEKHKL